MRDRREFNVQQLQDRGLLLVEDGNHGEYRPRHDEFAETGTAFIRAANLDAGHVHFDSASHIDDVALARIRKGIGQPNDVLLSHKGTVGKTAWVGTSPPPYVCSPQTTFYRSLAPAELHPRYLYFFLSSPVFQRQLHTRKGETDMADYVSLTEQRRLRIVIPAPEEQAAIVHVLGALDDKVETNREVIRECDETWFAYARRIVEDPASGTRSVPLVDLASFVNGRAFTKGATRTGRMVIRIAELNGGPGNSTVYNDIEVAEEHLARPGDLLFAWSGSLTVQRWFRSEAIVNQHIFKVVPSAGVPMWLVHAQLLTLLEQFRAIAADKATTMGHIQRRHLEVAVRVPVGDALARANETCDPLWQRALAAERETLALEALRDALLPPLLSGELQLREAEAMVKEAV